MQIACILPFYSSQETLVEAVARVAHVSSMFGNMQVPVVIQYSVLCVCYQCYNSYMDDVYKENLFKPFMTIAEVQVGIPACFHV